MFFNIFVDETFPNFLRVGCWTGHDDGHCCEPEDVAWGQVLVKKILKLIVMTAKAKQLRPWSL